MGNCGSRPRRYCASVLGVVDYGAHVDAHRRWRHHRGAVSVDRDAGAVS